MTHILSKFPFGLCLAISAGTPALALESILTLDFEEGTAGATVQAETVEVGGGLGSFEGALAQYSDVQNRPGGGSLSLLMQDSLFADGSNQPQVFWDLDGGNALDTSRTLKFSYWHYVSDTTVVGNPQTATAGKFQHAVLTASDAARARPEGNGGYLANAWNFQDGPTGSGTLEYLGDVDAGVFPQPLIDGATGQAVSLNTGAWHRIDSYIPLIDLYDLRDASDPLALDPGTGSPLFQGLPDFNDLDGDLDTTENLGYVDLTGRNYDEDPNNDRPYDISVFYSRVSDASGNTLGQTPYMFRRPSNHGVAGEPGDSDPDFRLRALQLVGIGPGWKTSFYDDITFGYVDTGDITTSIEAIAAGSSSGEYDYNADGTVDNDDAVYFIQTVLLTSFGDANYDYKFDQADLDLIAPNFNTATSGWENGDFTGDGQVNQADLDLVGAFWHHSIVHPDNFTPIPVAGNPDFQQALIDAGIVVGAEILGDYNDNGLVEQGDLNQVLNNWGTDFASVSATWINQRPTDGIVDQAELNVVLNRWGSDSAPDFSGSAVPEPASLVLLGLGGLTMLRRRG